MPCPGALSHREECPRRVPGRDGNCGFSTLYPLGNGQNWPDLLNLHILQWFLELKG